MKKGKKKTIYGIIGLGRFGFALAKELSESGADLLVIDRDEDVISAAKEFTENAFIVNRLDRKTLTETGIEDCDVVVVCIGEAIDTSILTTLTLVSMGIPKVIAKTSSVEHGEILQKLGAEVVFPERDMAVRLANRLESSKVLDYVQLSEKINISKNIVPEELIGKSVIDCDLRKNFGLNIIAIENDGNVIDYIRPDYVFNKGDIIFLSGNKSGFLKFENWLNTL